ncbi:Uma2 family endonuclease [Streptomyces sp. SID8379]|nr:Uma2 family endonuclease [Streptomyces sp. SID8379]MYW68990.1 Uma2 family endonuclease [Streptomyces sp. SID8379]
MRAIAEELARYARRLEGSWSVEIGPAGPVLAMVHLPERHEETVRSIRGQLNEQLPASLPGHVCVRRPRVEHPATGRLRCADAVVVPDDAFDGRRFAADASQALAAIEIVSSSNPDNDYRDKLADYPAMGIAHYLIVDPRTGTIDAHSDLSDGRYRSKESYIYGDRVPLGPWAVETGDFRRYERAGGRSE